MADLAQARERMVVEQLVHSNIQCALTVDLSPEVNSPQDPVRFVQRQHHGGLVVIILFECGLDVIRQLLAGFVCRHHPAKIWHIHLS